jgi:hypothetical protein
MMARCCTLSWAAGFPLAAVGASDRWFDTLRPQSQATSLGFATSLGPQGAHPIPGGG